jgi:hypothetical protein
MNITFGMFLDGAQWSKKKASLGEIVCGPASFLALLEQRTGLAGIEVTPPECINEYRAKIEAVKPEWCRLSFSLTIGQPPNKCSLCVMNFISTAGTARMLQVKD